MKTSLSNYTSVSLQTSQKSFFCYSGEKILIILFVPNWIFCETNSYFRCHITAIIAYFLTQNFWCHIQVCKFPNSTRAWTEDCFSVESGLEKKFWLRKKIKYSTMTVIWHLKYEFVSQDVILGTNKASKIFCFPGLHSETSPDHARVSFYLCLRSMNNEDRMTPQRGRAMFLNAAQESKLPWWG